MSCRSSRLSSPTWQIKRLFFPERKPVSPTNSTTIALTLPTLAICCPAFAEFSTGNSDFRDENQKQITSDASLIRSVSLASILKSPGQSSRLTRSRLFSARKEHAVVRFHPVVLVKLLTGTGIDSMIYTTPITNDTNDTRSNMHRNRSRPLIMLPRIT